jgi:hypothetical protein
LPYNEVLQFISYRTQYPGNSSNHAFWWNKCFLFYPNSQSFRKSLFLSGMSVYQSPEGILGKNAWRLMVFDLWEWMMKKVHSHLHETGE